MKARAHRCGGFLRVRSSVRGTIVSLRVPLPYRAK
jgi:signal transduction histidine kinase